jgi:small subunit ribosomal protein S20
LAHVSHSKSAIKRARQSLVRAERNQARRTEARSAVRAAREAIEGGDKEAAQAAVNNAAAILDRTASKGTIHANNASRRKSRLAKQLSAMDAK